MPATRYALYALEALLGAPERVTRERDGNAAATRVAWECECAAFGRSTTALEVTPCASHRTLFESEPGSRH